MYNYKQQVLKIIDEADIVFEVVDARFPLETSNNYIEKYALSKGKQLLILANKEDLISVEYKRQILKQMNNKKIVFLSAKLRSGFIKLRRIIGKLSKGKKVKIAIFGYPNTGKSSIINVLKGRHSAPTSPESGFTRGQQYIKISKNILLIDSPGILEYTNVPEEQLALINAKSVDHVRDIEGCATYLLSFISKVNKNALEEFYKIKFESVDSFLENLASEKKFFTKGNNLDIARASRLVLSDWQKGKIKIF
ncbi:MAG: 50S ribosome-binding GTPase [Candidatus Diapherotrites archaeon]|nr:50S ribosome-binding GTPase [Candidatus Diapherotrites archaeon]